MRTDGPATAARFCSIVKWKSGDGKRLAHVCWNWNSFVSWFMFRFGFSANRSLSGASGGGRGCHCLLITCNTSHALSTIHKLCFLTESYWGGKRTVIFLCGSQLTVKYNVRAALHCFIRVIRLPFANVLAFIFIVHFRQLGKANTGRWERVKLSPGQSSSFS